MGKEISLEENIKMKAMLRGMIDRAKDKDDCKYLTREITRYALEGYDVVDLEKELFYKKERWLLNLSDPKCLS